MAAWRSMTTATRRPRSRLNLLADVCQDGLPRRLAFPHSSSVIAGYGVRDCGRQVEPDPARCPALRRRDDGHRLACPPDLAPAAAAGKLISWSPEPSGVRVPMATCEEA